MLKQLQRKSRPCGFRGETSSSRWMSPSSTQSACSSSNRSFHSGTQAVAHAVAGCKGFTLAGGGDTMAAIEKFHVADRIDYISTAGGAFLE